MKLVVSIYMGPEGSIFAEMSTALRYATWKTEICNIPVHLIMVGERLQRHGRIRTQCMLQYCHAYLLPSDLNRHTLHLDWKLKSSRQEVTHDIQWLGSFCSFSHDLPFSKPQKKGGATLSIHSVALDSFPDKCQQNMKNKRLQTIFLTHEIFIICCF